MSTSEDRQRRGVLYPQRLPEFHRLMPPDDLIHALSWFWIPEWDLPDGQRSVQQLLPFPACNIVVEGDTVSAVGPPTVRSERVLAGSGWAVGALLRPAAARLLICDLAGVGDLTDLRDSARPLEEPALQRAVAGAMSDAAAEPGARRAAAAEAFADWIRSRVPDPGHGSEGALANELAVAIADPSVIRVSDLEARLHASTRTLQRIAARFFGLSPHSMIRRRRLQEAAERLREDPVLPIARIATELGYADHAHFSSDFKALLGVTPSAYRESAGLAHDH